MRFWRSWVSLALLGVPLMAAPQWKDRYAEVNGVKLHYVEEGQGPLILFLHGFPEFWYEWKDLLPEFGKDHHAVAPDMRGYNLSDKPEKVESYAVPVIVEDVRALAEKLGAKKFVLVGHDWGGVIAWAFAGAHPEMLEKLVIVNAPHPTVFGRELANNPDQQKASAYFNLFNFAGRGADAIRERLSGPARPAEGLGHGRRSQGLSGELESRPDRRPELLSRGATAFAGGRRGGPELSPVLTAPLMITTPTLVIWGEKDTALLTGNLDGLDKYVKHLKIVRVPDGTPLGDPRKAGAGNPNHA